MNSPTLPLAAIAAGILLGGCANFTKTEIAEIRAQGVPPAIVGKIEHGHVLSPAEIIELSRHGVSDRIILKQIDDTGLSYVIAKDDIAKLHAAHVSQTVIDAIIAESDRFARSFNPGFGPTYVSPYDDQTYGPNPYRYTYDAAAGVGFSSYHGPRTYDPYVWRR